MASDDNSVDSIVETLTEKLYSHDYLISRREAKSIGLKIADPDAGTEVEMVGLYEAYASDLEFGEAFNPIAEVRSVTQRTFSLDRAYIESVGRLDAFQTERTFTKLPDGNIQDQILREGWSEIK
jgi:hypothetical protein